MNFDIRPDLLTIKRTPCELPHRFLDKSKFAWLPVVSTLDITPGIFWRDAGRHLIFRLERDEHHYIFTDWKSLMIYRSAGVEEAIAVKISNSFYQEMQQPGTQEITLFDYWLAQKLNDYFEKEN